MKRAMWFAAVAALAACSPTPPETDRQGADAVDGWTQPPVIERVQRSGTALVASGSAEPGARVVLRSDGGAAFAASADSRGRFEIRMGAPAQHVLFRPETQIGQDAAASPDRLLILDGGRGPVVVLRPGGPTRRLDVAPALGAVDSDGRMRLASGQAAAGTRVVEVQAGDETVQVAPDPHGRWSVMLARPDGPGQIRVAGRSFDWPGDGVRTDTLTVQRLQAGWRVDWAGPGGGRQSTWLPDPAPA